MVIKVISLWQPWAWAMWNGLKTYETRSDKFVAMAGLRKYRGEWLGIHAAQLSMNKAIEKSLSDDPDREYVKRLRVQWIASLRKHSDYRPLPDIMEFGALGGICRCGEIYQTQTILPQLTERERFFGNYESGRRAIHCHDMVKLHQPIAMRGYQSSWNWQVPLEIEEMLKAVSA